MTLPIRCWHVAAVCALLAVALMAVTLYLWTKARKGGRQLCKTIDDDLDLYNTQYDNYLLLRPYINVLQKSDAASKSGYLRQLKSFADGAAVILARRPLSASEKQSYPLDLQSLYASDSRFLA